VFDVLVLSVLLLPLVSITDEDAVLV